VVPPPEIAAAFPAADRIAVARPRELGMCDSGGRFGLGQRLIRRRHRCGSGRIRCSGRIRWHVLVFAELWWRRLGLAGLPTIGERLLIVGSNGAGLG
jgi:hypothetical protein